jgi:hypothetical protein
MSTLAELVQAILDPLTPGGAWYAVNTTEPLALDSNGAVKPYIVWQEIVSTDNVTLGGPTDMQNTRIQVDVYAPRIAVASSLTKAVDAALLASALTVIPLSNQPVYEEPVRLWRRIRDYSIWHVES